MNSITKPPAYPIQEFRFAVVMYGGVSLAIYINGITQELLELVKSTAPDKGNVAYISTEDLSASGKVYRKIGQLLGNKLLQSKEKLQVSDITSEMPISSRFVIDILSGTSAGGINAVFLAKALANDQKIDQLKELWIQEGDLNKLINDSQSVNDDKMQKLGLKVKSSSLLNGQRMYIKLLEALENMGKESNNSPYVDELDLFVTATNLRGQVIPIQLKDKTVAEKNHRHIFHFKKIDNHRNDFSAKYSPFLAFVARCTSSFPLAFEPMTLGDALELLKLRASYKKEDLENNLTEWKKLFFATNTNKSICGEDNKPLEIEDQAFGDGGYLDNKPFTYATEALLRRRSDLPVKRHLIYIEPSPEHPENDSISKVKPNAIENSVSALITIPRNETIREDIERIINRNKIIRRIDRITNNSKLEDDVKIFNDRYAAKTTNNETGSDWMRKSLNDLIIEKGISYGSYHRLKLAAVTDELARLITRVSGFNYDDESAEFLAIRLFLRQWRDDKYCESPALQDQKLGKKTQTEFLLNYDFEHRLRRLYFVCRKINDLYSSEDLSLDVIEKLKLEEERKSYYQGKEPILRGELIKIKKKLDKVIQDLLLVKSALEKSGQDDNSEESSKIQRFSDDIKAVGIDVGFLKSILIDQTEVLQINTLKTVKIVLENKGEILEKLATTLAEIFRNCFDKATEDCKAAMNLEDCGADIEAILEIKRLARRYVKLYYDNHEYYDMGIFPIIYGTDVGEANEVEIIRISPEDATNLNFVGNVSRRKLAGTSFFAFGGFFNEDWRKNDILWGRLDGAERLISTLLPEEKYHDIRTDLIKEAHQGILAEELEVQKKQDLLNTVLKNLENIQHPEQQESAKQYLDFLKNYFDDGEIYKLFKRSYEVNRELLPETLLGYLSRSTQVFGNVLDDISKQTKRTSVVAPWLTRFGRILWALIEVASPRPNIFNISIAKYWLPLIFVFEIFLFIAGFFLQNKAFQELGLQTCVITMLFALSVMWLKDFLQNETGFMKWVKFASIVFAIGLLSIGIRYLCKYGFSDLFGDFNRFIINRPLA